MHPARLPLLYLLPLGLLATTLLLLNCGSEGRSEGWQRLDLFYELPRLEDNNGRTVPGGARRKVVFLGASEVRDLSRLNAHQLRTVPQVSAGQVHALEQVLGTRLVMRSALGRDGYFSFVPLPSEAEGAGVCTHRILAAGEDGDERELLAVEASLPARTLSVDLEDFEGELTLALEVSCQGRGPALWGSPAIVSRGMSIPGRRSERPHVLLIGIDTLRADSLGAYGRRPSLTPALDRLASQSDVFLRAYSAFNVTNPSFTSILTGLYGKHHGIYDNRTVVPKEPARGLAHHFDAAGYETVAVVSANHLQTLTLGLGFEERAVPDLHFAGEQAVNTLISWIQDRLQGKKSAPFFAWIHLYDPHTPHTPPEPYASGYHAERPFGLGPVETWRSFRPEGPREFVNQVYGGQRDLYDGEVAYLDRQIDRLLAFLESHGLLDDTVIAFVADHGENLEEHGISYGHEGLWETTVHVPLMIRWPDRQGAGRRLEGLVQTLDLYPTLLTAAGLPAPPSDGQNLRRLADEDGSRPVVFAEHAHLLGVMVRTRDHKYIRLSDGDHFDAGEYLYDLNRDRGETDNLAGREPEIEARLAGILDRWLADRTERLPTADLTPEEEKKLRALGYIR